MQQSRKRNVRANASNAIADHLSGERLENRRGCIQPDAVEEICSSVSSR